MQQLKTGTGGAHTPLSEILPAARVRSLCQDDKRATVRLFARIAQNDRANIYSKSSFTPASTLIVGALNPNACE